MFPFSSSCQNQCTNSSKVQRQFRIAALRVLHNKALQVLREHPDCDKNIFNATNCQRLHVLKSFSPQLNDQVDSGALNNSLLLHLIIKDHSLNTSNGQNDTDAGKIEKKVFRVFIKTELVTSPSTKVPPE